MDEETVNQETQPAAEPAEQTAAAEAAEEPARSFSQAEVDAIIGDRLQRERAKFKADLKAAQDREHDLQSQLDSLKAENSIREARAKVSAELGIPADLLTGTTEKECKEQAEKLIKWRGEQPNYPESGDGGAITGFVSGKARDQFAAFARDTLNL